MMNRTVEQQKRNIKKREEQELKIKVRFYLCILVLVVVALLSIFVNSWSIYDTLIVIFWLEFSALKDSISDIKEKLNIPLDKG
jgi:uncharacterized membrane protein